MRRFEIREPKSIEEACKIALEEQDAKFIAGGTALLIAIKQGIFLPKTLINLKKITGVDDITYSRNDGLRIGGLATIYEIENSSVVREHYPLLAQACHVVANIRIRSMATIAGNLAHADHQSDPPTALVALNASVELTSERGCRSVKLTDFLLGPYETGLERGELIRAVLVPPPEETAKGTYVKFTTRSSEDRPCAGVAVTTRWLNGVCAEARVVVGAVSATPVVVHGGVLVKSKQPGAEWIEEIADKAHKAVDPVDDLRGTASYKRRLVKVLVQRALHACVS